MTPFRILVKTIDSPAPQRAWAIKHRTAYSNIDYVFDLPGKPPDTTAERDGDVLLMNEGITWCREWTGEIPDAFRAAVALR